MPLPSPGAPAAWVLTAALLASGGCVRTTPRDRDAEAALRHEIDRDGKGLIRLLRFQATGGQRSTFLGVATYTTDYSAEIEFLGDACYGGGLSAHPYLPPHYDPSGLPAAGDSLGACFRVHVSRGERREVAGSLSFESVGRGRWRGPDGQLY